MMYRNVVNYQVQLVPIKSVQNGPMSDLADRLSFLRRQKDWTSMTQAAKAYGIGYEVYKKMASHASSDPRNLTVENATIIAAKHKVSLGWLMFGEGSPEGFHRVDVVGEIGAGQAIHAFDDTEAFEKVSSEIASADGAAFEVKGDSMYPLARDGDMIFVGPERKGKDVADLIGSECAVVLEDGRRFFKVIENGSKRGLYNLVSYNADPIRDVAIHSAGLFLGLRRSQRSRRHR